MRYSLYEIEVTCKRAARGAGMYWGLAEEAGKAVRWLSAQGMPGPKAFAALLKKNDHIEYQSMIPVLSDGVWQRDAGYLCPLIIGTALCDRVGEMATAQESIQIGPMLHPLLLLPFAAAISKITQCEINVSWSDAEFLVSENSISVTDKANALTLETVETAYFMLSQNPMREPSACNQDYSVDTSTWVQLNTFAQRTFAPASEASRLTGAGAGLSDTD